MLISSLSRGPYIVEDSGIDYRRGFFQEIITGNVRTEGDLTWILQREVILCAQTCMETLTIGPKP